jgi:hypothetical protein
LNSNTFDIFAASIRNKVTKRQIDDLWMKPHQFQRFRQFGRFWRATVELIELNDLLAKRRKSTVKILIRQFGREYVECPIAAWT